MGDGGWGMGDNDALHSTLSSGELAPQRHGTAYRRVRFAEAASFDTRCARGALWAQDALRDNLTL